jgi:hypothetical protein
MNVDPFEEKLVWILFSDIFLFWTPKSHFCTRRHENKHKMTFLILDMPIQFQLLEMENPKKIQKSTPPVIQRTIYID